MSVRGSGVNADFRHRLRAADRVRSGGGSPAPGPALNSTG
jgi:hypothetical protein